MKRQGSIQIGCVYSLLELTSHQMSVPVRWSSSEQVGTGLQSWPPNGTSKGWGWGWGPVQRGSQGRGPVHGSSVQ